jgi:DNA polymerase V
MSLKQGNVKLKLLNPQIDELDRFVVEGVIKAGFPSPATDYLANELNLKELLVRNESATFFVEVEGDSMKGANIFNGDIIIVDKSLNPHDNSVVACFLDGEFTLKRVEKIDGSFFLVPDNPKFKPIRINEDSDFRLWGIVTYVIHKLR